MNFIKMSFLLIAFVPFPLFAAYADSPPSWMPVESKSENGAYIAKVSSREESSQKTQETKAYILKIYSAKDTSKSIWEIPYAYQGCAGGVLSNDGQVFVYPEFWFSEQWPLINIYSAKGLMRAISASEVIFDHAKIEQTASHQLWLDKNGECAPSLKQESDSYAFLFCTIDQKKHSVQIKLDGDVGVDARR